MGEGRKEINGGRDKEGRETPDFLGGEAEDLGEPLPSALRGGIQDKVFRGEEGSKGRGVDGFF